MVSVNGTSFNNLLELNFFNKCVGYIGADIIADKLSSAKKLTYINLGRILRNLGFCKIAVDGVKRLVLGFNECHTLKEVQFGIV